MHLEPVCSLWVYRAIIFFSVVRIHSKCNECTERKKKPPTTRRCMRSASARRPCIVRASVQSHYSSIAIICRFHMAWHYFDASMIMILLGLPCACCMFLRLGVCVCIFFLRLFRFVFHFVSLSILILINKNFANLFWFRTFIRFTLTLETHKLKIHSGNWHSKAYLCAWCM